MITAAQTDAIEEHHGVRKHPEGLLHLHLEHHPGRRGPHSGTALRLMFLFAYLAIRDTSSRVYLRTALDIYWCLGWMTTFWVLPVVYKGCSD
jgi:hypothetical protein